MEKKLKVCLDVDGVILDFEEALRKMLKEKGITFRPENRTSYTFDGDIGCTKRAVKNNMYKYGRRVYELLEPFDGALDAVNTLLSMDNIEVHAYTCGLTPSLCSERVVFCKSIGLKKGSVYSKKKPPVRGAYALIDDCLHVHEDWVTAGSNAKLYLIDASHNQMTEDNKDKDIWNHVTRCKDLQDAVQKLLLDISKEKCLVDLEEIIRTIEEEFESSNNSRYTCKDGTIISTDVGYVEQWFNEYKEVLRKRYKSLKPNVKTTFTCSVQDDSINKNGRIYDPEVLKKSMEKHNEVMHIEIPRLKSVNDPLWVYDKTSYRKALTDDRMVELLKTGRLQCEFGYPAEDGMIRLQTIDPAKTCARIIKIDDDFITVVPLDNELGNEFTKQYLSNPDKIYAGMRAMCNGDKIEKIITFDIIMK